MDKNELIGKIKERIPKDRKVYLEGEYDDGSCCYLWWYAWCDGDILWIEFEDIVAPPGCKVQQASDFDDDALESVLDSMTDCTETI